MSPVVSPVGRANPLAGIELAIFDKDGTLIDFHLMWSDWVRALAGISLDGAVESGGHGLLIAATERRTVEEIDGYAAALAKAVA